MSFDVASVKANAAPMGPDTTSANVPMGPGDYFGPTGGLFSARDMPLFNYITFAYKATSNDAKLLRDQLPKWALNDRFDVEARGPANATKDQMRLMMQSLLADRFKLVMRRETRQVPAFALVLVNPGKLGPQIQAHPSDVPCSSALAPGVMQGTTQPPSPVAGGFPATCGGIQGMDAVTPGRERFGGRDVTMTLVASTMTGLGNLDRPVVDRTALTGGFDFTMEWTPQSANPSSQNADSSTDPNELPFLAALKEQLGLKLQPTTAPIDSLVINHIEEPSPN
jgi:bla regulator protein BlaR1